MPNFSFGKWTLGAIALLAGGLTLAACGSDDGGAIPGTGGAGTGGDNTAGFGAGGDNTAGFGAGGDNTAGFGAGGISTGGASGAGGGTVCVGTPTSTCADRLCDLMPGCTASVPAACTGEADGCSVYDGNVAGCNAHWGCGLAANGVCSEEETTCFDYGSQAYCEAVPGCWWSGLFCNGDIVRNCSAPTSLAACEANPACLWTPSTVQYCGGAAIACAPMSSETCEMQTGCLLTPAVCSGTPSPCEGLSQTQCFLQPGCQLASGGTHTIVPTGVQVTAPDLTFDVLHLWRSGDELVLDFAQINRGSANAPAHSSTIFLSANDTFGDADDYQLYVISSSFVLPPYGLDTGTLFGIVNMPTVAELAPGYYYPIGVLDSGQVVTELEEANNVRVLPAIYVGPNMFDLALLSATHSLTGTLAPGQSFDMSLSVHNLSTETVASAAVAVYLSADDTLSADDLAVDCTASLDLNLAASAQGVYPITCALPRARGTYNVLAQLDPTDALSDANRTNNLAVAAGTVTVDAPAPDLEVTLLSSSSYAVNWMGTVTVTATVANTGTDPAPASSINFYLGGTEPMCNVSVGALAAGSSTEVTRVCTLSSNAIGTLPLRAEVDPSDAIFEASETNNSLQSATDFVVAEPDVNLVAAGVGLVAGGAERTAGQTLQVYYTIENDRTQNAPPYRVVFYASVDATITTNDIEFCIRDVQLGQTAGTTTAGASTDCLVPTMPTGDYYIGMIVDTENVIPETDESDNVTVDTQNLLTITP
jgi:hypothetical protein